MPLAHTGHTCSQGWCRRLLLDSCAALGGRQRTWPRMAFAGCAGSDCLCRHCSCKLLRRSCVLRGWPESNAALCEGGSELWTLVVCCVHQATVGGCLLWLGLHACRTSAAWKTWCNRAATCRLLRPRRGVSWHRRVHLDQVLQQVRMPPRHAVSNILAPCLLQSWVSCLWHTALTSCLR
jgi:hypothetical protein